jgi:hypothetical protein
MLDFENTTKYFKELNSTHMHVNTLSLAKYSCYLIAGPVRQLGHGSL